MTVSYQSILYLQQVYVAYEAVCHSAKAWPKVLQEQDGDSKQNEKEINQSVATAQRLQLDRNAAARPSESRALMNPNKPQ